MIGECYLGATAIGDVTLELNPTTVIGGFHQPSQDSVVKVYFGVLSPTYEERAHR